MSPPSIVGHSPKEVCNLPFLGLDPSFPENLADAERTIRSIQDFDFDERVFVVCAHDVSLFDILDFYPKTASDWKQKGWKEKGRWAFLAHLQKVARGAQMNEERPLEIMTVFDRDI